MVPAKATRYRALVARLNFLSIGMPDIEFACKDASRNMATPFNEGKHEDVRIDHKYVHVVQRELDDQQYDDDVGHHQEDEDERYVQRPEIASPASR